MTNSSPPSNTRLKSPTLHSDKTNHQESFDAIVIGSGAGGMTAAAYLAAAGKRTLVLESYTVIGGCTHVFRRKNKWEFDVGIHYLGDCGPQGVIPTLLNGVGLKGKVEFLPLDPAGFDTIVFPDRTLKVPKGWDQYRKNLIAAFPDEEKKILKVVGILEKIGRSIDRSTTPASLPGLAKFMAKSGLNARWALRTLTQLLDAHQLSSGLKSAFAVQYGTYASPPHRTPVAVHATMLQNFLRDGAWFPKGGGQVLSARLGEVIVANGGEIRTRAPVGRILIENKKVVGVELENGTRINAPIVVSNADIKNTYLKMVGRKHIRRSTAWRINRMRMSQPFFNCYLGVDIDLTELMPNTNFYSIPTSEDMTSLYYDLSDNRGGYSPDELIEQSRKRLGAYISVTSTKDRGNLRAAPAGCSVLEAMTLCPEDLAFWGLDHWPEDGDESYRKNARYQASKEALTQIMIQRVSEVIPGIEKHIVWCEAATPLTQHRYTRASGGTPYGIELSISQFVPFRPGVRTEINGLYMCGASMAWGPAVEGAMLSGMHAAAAVLNRDLDAEIRSGKVLGVTLPADPEGEWDPFEVAQAVAGKRRRRRVIVR